MEDIKELNKRYQSYIGTADKKDILFIAHKDDLKGKMLGFLTSNYYKRKKLILQGELIYILTYKTWTNNYSEKSFFPTWNLFSFEPFFQNDSNNYYKVLEKLEKQRDNPNKSKRMKEIFRLLDEVIYEPEYRLLPPEEFDGHFLYISSIYTKSKYVDNLTTGINLAIANKAISKEILFIPDKFKEIIKKDSLDKKE